MASEGSRPGAQRRGRPQWAGWGREDACSVPTSLLSLSPAGSHWLGLWPVTEGGAPGGHQPARGGPLTCYVLLPCRSPCACPQHQPVMATSLPPTSPACWPSPTLRGTGAALHRACGGQSPVPIFLAFPNTSPNAFPEGKFCLKMLP